MSRHLHSTIGPRLCSALLLLLLPIAGPAPALDPAPAAAAPESALDQEFRFMSGLIELKLGDFAEKALQRFLLRHPDQKERAKVIEAEILISKRNFTEAETIAKSLPPENPRSQTIRLAIANGYYRYGDVEKAKVLYQEFFNQFQAQKPTDPDLLRTYQDSAYQYAIMLKGADDLAGAVAAYDRVLQTNLERDLQRRVQAEQAQLCVDLAVKTDDAKKREEYLGKAWKISTDLMWGGIDLAFGDALVSAARAEKARGSPAKAEQSLRDNLDILKSIDDALKQQGSSLSLSPLAGARFLIGEINEEQGTALAADPAKKNEAIGAYAKAINEYYNVFLKYGDSDWGPKAALKVTELKAKLEGMGKTVKIDLGDYRPKAGPEQFRLPDSLYRQKDYAKAIPEYLKVLNQYPDSDYSLNALLYLLLSYANTGDALSAKMLIRYLGERFAGKETAANAMLLAGKYYFDHKDPALYEFAYENFLTYFPKHPRAGGILYTLAGVRKNAGDTAGRLAYLERIISDFQRDKYYATALQTLAWENFSGERYEDAVKFFALYLADAQPGPDKAKAQFALAGAQLRLGRHNQALQDYSTLIKWLDPKQGKTPFDTSAEAQKQNADLLEKSIYQLAHALSLLQTAPDQQAAIRQNAIKAFDHFLATYPAAELAPKAMSGKGRMQLALGQFDAATATFNDLAQKYPQSDEGKNALYSLIKAAMEVGKVDIARDAFKRLIENKASYSVGEFARLGKLMLDVKAYPEAAQAYQEVLNSNTEERALLERALFGLGQASFETKDFQTAVKNLADLTARYPNSRLAFAAKFMLAAAYRQTDPPQPEQAIAALTDIFKFAEDPEYRTRASYELAQVELQRGNKDAAFAAFQRVILLEDPKNPKVRPFYEKCALESLPLGMELQKYQDVVENCDLYLNNYPESTKVEEIRRIKTEAKQKLLMSP